MPHVIVLDFDGVLCDSLKECMLVTWHGAHGHGVEAFSQQGVEALPRAFVERFTSYRPFAQHLGHFAVALQEDAPAIRTQAAFEAVYHSLGTAYVQLFCKLVTTYRHQVRRALSTTWLAMHDFSPEVLSLCTQIPRSYIVTARDQVSVLALLEQKGIAMASEQVLGEQSPKLAALTLIAEREGVPPDALIFVDDHLSHVLAAQRAGYRAYWATWGYHLPEHRQQAVEQGVVPLALGEVAQLTRKALRG